jgi:chromosome segregation ATPase
MPAPDPAEQSDLLRRLLDFDRVIEDLDAEIKAADAELRDMRSRRQESVAARAKLSQEIRKPTPILGGVGETPDLKHHPE